MLAEGEYLRLSEELNALDYLEKAVAFVRSAISNPVDWKWVVLALHGSIYGFMICSLKGTDPSRVINRTKRGDRLTDFGEALRRCQDPAWMNMTYHSQPLTVSGEQKRALDYIHEEFRNRFIHYQPCLWSIELNGLPGILAHGFDIARFLSIETGNCVHLTAEECKKIDQLVGEAKGVLASI